MRKLFFPAFLVFTVITLIGCDIIDLATEVISDPPVVHSVSFDADDETITIDIRNMPENGTLHTIRINGSDVAFEKTSNGFVIQMFELKETNIINRVEVDTGTRILPVPINYNLDNVIEEQLSNHVSNHIFLPGKLANTELEEMTLIDNLEELKDFYEDYLKDHIDDPLIDKVIDANLKVVEDFLSTHTVVAFNQLLDLEAEVIKIDDYKVNDNQLTINVSSSLSDTTRNSLIIAFIPDIVTFDTIEIIEDW